MKRDRSIIKGAATGLIAGVVASLVMNKFQSALSELVNGQSKSHGAQSQQSGSPGHGAGAFLKKLNAEDANDDAAERTANVVAAAVLNKRLSKQEKDLGGTIFHYAFGASAGAFYGAASEVVPQIRSGVGLPFGFAVWLLADEFVVPALGLWKSAAEYPPSIHGYALASHLVYGLTTEVTHRLVHFAWP